MGLATKKTKETKKKNKTQHPNNNQKKKGRQLADGESNKEQRRAKNLTARCFGSWARRSVCPLLANCSPTRNFPTAPGIYYWVCATRRRNRPCARLWPVQRTK